MRFALIEVTVTMVRVATMHHNKDTQEEIIILEAAVWAFWILFFGLSYLLAKILL
jgi:hypothetical protein